MHGKPALEKSSPKVRSFASYQKKVSTTKPRYQKGLQKCPYINLHVISLSCFLHHQLLQLCGQEQSRGPQWPWTSRSRRYPHEILLLISSTVYVQTQTKKYCKNIKTYVPSDNLKYSIIWHLSGPVQVGLTEFWCILKLLNFTFILYGDICSTFDDIRWTSVTVYIYKYGVFIKGLFQFSVLSRPFLLSLVCLLLQWRNYWQHLKVPYGPSRNCVTIFIWIFKEALIVSHDQHCPNSTNLWKCATYTGSSLKRSK